MNQQRRQALILTPCTIPGHQIASLIERHGWTSVSIHNAMPPAEIMQHRPGMLVVDITRQQVRNLDVIARYRQDSAMSYILALCEGGNTRAMRMARMLGVDGFFYLNRHGKAIDPGRGMAPLFLRHQPAHCPVTHPSAATISPVPVMC